LLSRLAAGGCLGRSGALRLVRFSDFQEKLAESQHQMVIVCY
jgi:hypothetical protein